MNIIPFGLENSPLPNHISPTNWNFFRTLGGAATLQEKGEEKLVPHRKLENGSKQRNNGEKMPWEDQAVQMHIDCG